MNTYLRNACRLAVTAWGALLFCFNAEATESYSLTLAKGGAVLVNAADGSSRIFEPHFMVLAVNFDPKFELRYPDLGDKRMKKRYNVASWTTAPMSGAGGKKDVSEIARLSR